MTNDGTAVGGKFAIQRFWFGDATANDVLELYNLKVNTPKWNSALKILLKSKKQFVDGFSHFTREDVDRRICRLCMND